MSLPARLSGYRRARLSVHPPAHRRASVRPRTRRIPILTHPLTMCCAADRAFGPTPLSIPSPLEVVYPPVPLRCSPLRISPSCGEVLHRSFFSTWASKGAFCSSHPLLLAWLVPSGLFRLSSPASALASFAGHIDLGWRSWDGRRFLRVGGRLFCLACAGCLFSAFARSRWGSLDFDGVGVAFPGDGGPW